MNKDIKLPDEVKAKRMLKADTYMAIIDGLKIHEVSPWVETHITDFNSVQNIIKLLIIKAFKEI